MTKINIEKTKLKNESGRLEAFFHVTPKNQGIQRYYPLSHFGTKEAANMRASHFVYTTNELKEPDKSVSVEKLSDLLQLSELKLPPLSMQKVYLYMKHPKQLNDFGEHSFYSYQQWFSNHYSPKSQYLSPREWQELAGLGTRDMRYKKLLTEFIFIDPFRNSKEDLIKELNSENLFDAKSWENEGDPRVYPVFLRPVLEQAKKVPFALAERVAFQRMIRFLEGEGYDGFKYINQYEDVGKLSYIIFRPEQAFNALCLEQQHEVLPLAQSQTAFLSQQEHKFFSAHDLLSPSERIKRHNALKKEKQMSFPSLKTR